MGAAFGNSPDKVGRYIAFWNRALSNRPLVCFTLGSWYPLNHYSVRERWRSAEYVTPEMIDPEELTEDEERTIAEGEEVEDDVFRGISPSQALAWEGGMLGARNRVLESSVLAEERTLPWEELEETRLNRLNPWVEKYYGFLKTIVSRSKGRYAASHAQILGPSDQAAIVRGHTQSILDLVDEPDRAAALLRRLGAFLCEIHEEAQKVIPTFLGGYFYAQYCLWAPGPILRLTEDASALYSPTLYRRFLQPVDRAVSSRFPYTFIHLHSTSLFLLDALLEIDEMRCFQVNNDVNGPPIQDMMPAFEKIQRANRPLLIRGSFTPDDFRLFADHLDARGLFLFIMARDLHEIETLRPLVGM